MFFNLKKEIFFRDLQFHFYASKNKIQNIDVLTLIVKF